MAPNVTVRCAFPGMLHGSTVATDEGSSVTPLAVENDGADAAQMGSRPLEVAFSSAAAASASAEV